MALLVLDTGLRLNECLQLEVRDVDLENFLVTVQKGKGDRQRRVPISAMGRKVLYRYISHGGNPARRLVTICVGARSQRASRYSLSQFSFSVVVIVYLQIISTNWNLHPDPSQDRLR